MKATEQKALKFIDGQNLITKGDSILVAFSGGPDSVFLLYLLNKFKNLLGISLAAAHINHNLRGDESVRDEKFAQQFCENLNIRFFSVSVSVKKYASGNKTSLEEAGRELRYSFLKQLASEKGFNKIATAHNLNDNAETMLFNFLKGTGVSGLKGIPLCRENIIRPVLAVSRNEIENYLEDNKLDFVTDSSNKEDDFKRNFIRNKIIPLIKSEINPSFEDALFRSAQIFSSTEIILEKYSAGLIEKFVSFNDENFEVKLSLFENNPREIFGEVIKRSIEKFTGAEFSFSDYLNLLALAGNQTGTEIFIANNLSAVRERDCLLIRKRKVNEIPAAEKVDIGSVKNFMGVSIIAEENPDTDSLEFSTEFELVDADAISGNLEIRCWKEGDKFIPLGMRGFKKISDFLQDQKVPASNKQQQAVVTDEHNIIWVVGLRLDDRYKITKDTKRILKLRKL